MISHSAGELGCAYADEWLTIEQTNLSAYFIGLSYAEGEIMVLCNLLSFNYECLKNICRRDIEIVCRKNSSVISGHAESVQEFMEELQVELNSFCIL